MKSIWQRYVFMRHECCAANLSYHPCDDPGWNMKGWNPPRLLQLFRWVFPLTQWPKIGNRDSTSLQNQGDDRFWDRVLGHSFKEWKERGGFIPVDHVPWRLLNTEVSCSLQAETDLPLKPAETVASLKRNHCYKLQALFWLFLIPITKYDAVQPSAEYNDIKEMHICPSTVRTVCQEQDDEEKTGNAKILQYLLAMCSHQRSLQRLFCLLINLITHDNDLVLMLISSSLPVITITFKDDV